MPQSYFYPPTVLYAFNTHVPGGTPIQFLYKQLNFCPDVQEQLAAEHTAVRRSRAHFHVIPVTLHPRVLPTVCPSVLRRATHLITPRIRPKAKPKKSGPRLILPLVLQNLSVWHSTYQRTISSGQSPQNQMPPEGNLSSSGCRGRGRGQRAGSVPPGQGQLPLSSPISHRWRETKDLADECLDGHKPGLPDFYVLSLNS